MSVRHTIVTYGQLSSALNASFESVVDQGAAALAEEGSGGHSRAEMGAQIAHAMHLLESEDLGNGVMAAAQDQVTSLLQTFIAQRAVEEGKLEEHPSGGLEAKFDGHDIAGWAGSLFTWWRKLRPFEFIEASAKPEAVPDAARVGLLADWGSGLYGAPVSAESIVADGRFDAIFHMGDVYYSGENDEVQERFLDVWPSVPGAVNRACNGNHEMYTGGQGYAARILPAFGQQASYFAMQNDHWLLVGLDTAYKEHDLHGGQAEWLGGLLDEAGDRKVILFSHHQPFSLLGPQGPKLVGKLGDLLDGKKIFAWYWGHEHQCVIYDRHPMWDIYGRCIGHGGFPEFRDKKLLGEEVPASPTWRKLRPKPFVPGGMILDGGNPYIVGHEDRYYSHGYLALEFDEGVAVETVYNADGTLLWENDLT